MINGAESVRAMNPSLTPVTSGVSAAATLTAGEAVEEAAGLGVGAETPELQACRAVAVRAVALAVRIKRRLEMRVIKSFL